MQRPCGTTVPAMVLCLDHATQKPERLEHSRQKEVRWETDRTELLKINRAWVCTGVNQKATEGFKQKNDVMNST